MTTITLTQPRLEMSEQERFFKYFQNEVTALQEQMQIIQDHGTSGGERVDAIDHCLAGISRLSNDVKDISGSLPAHDQRTYSEAIKALSEKLQKVRLLAAPKPKFSFKSVKKNASAISLTDAAELAAAKRLHQTVPSTSTSTTSSYISTPAEPQTPLGEDESHPPLDSSNTGSIRKPSFSASKSIGIHNHSNIHIMLPSSATHATTTGVVSSIRDSVIDMSISSTSAFATLTLKTICNSLIICGHVSGAIHITGVKDSVILVASRQFRMHESKNVVVYLHSASRPIIEDCKDIKFAALPECYLTEKDKKLQNRFYQVDDFKWLKAEQSPNWGLLGEEDRIEEGVWTDVVSGGPNVGVEDVLKAVGVRAS